VRSSSTGINDNVSGNGDGASLSRQQHFPGIAAALDCLQPRWSKQCRTALDRNPAQPRFKTWAVKMPAMAIGIAQKVSFAPLRRSPARAIAIVRRVGLHMEGIQKSHIFQETAGCRKQRFTNSPGHFCASFDQGNVAQWGKVQGGSRARGACPNYKYVVVLHASAP
jgi:hypothetical protein